jgi:hypothetical protein
MEFLASLALHERRLSLANSLYEFGVDALNELMSRSSTGLISGETVERTLDTTGGWQLMAARDGAFSISHFGCAMEGVKNSLPFCLALNFQIDPTHCRMLRVTKRLPSAANSTLRTPLAWPLRTASRALLSVCQTRALPSSDAVTTSLLSRLRSALNTPPKPLKSLPRKRPKVQRKRAAKKA